MRRSSSESRGGTGNFGGGGKLFLDEMHVPVNKVVHVHLLAVFNVTVAEFVGAAPGQAALYAAAIPLLASAGRPKQVGELGRKLLTTSSKQPGPYRTTARFLATTTNAALWDPALAVRLAEKVVALSSNNVDDVSRVGGQEGVSNVLYVQPDRGLAVVLLTNLQDIRPFELARRIADIVAP